MRSKSLTCLAALLVCWIPVAAGSQPQFVEARHDPNAHIVRFVPFNSVDWTEFARRYFSRFDIDHPRPEDVAYLRDKIWEISNSAEITYRAPLDAQTRGGEFQLISADGVAPFRPAAFEGTISFSFDQAVPRQIVRRQIYGVVVSHRLSLGGGFVMRSDGLTIARVRDAHAELAFEDGVRVLRYSDRLGKAHVVLPDPWFREIRTAYGFSVARGRYLFVAWPADNGVVEAGCESNYSLYSVGKVLAQVMSSSYECDV